MRLVIWNLIGWTPNQLSSPLPGPLVCSLLPCSLVYGKAAQVSGRVAAVGLDTLGPALAVRRGWIANSGGGAAATRAHGSDGQGRLPVPAQGQGTLFPEQMALGQSSTGSLRGMWGAPAKHSFLLPMASNGSSLAILPQLFPAMPLLFQCLLEAASFSA